MPFLRDAKLLLKDIKLLVFGDKPHERATKHMDQGNWHYLFDILHSLKQNPAALALTLETVKNRTAEVIQHPDLLQIHHFRDLAHEHPPLMDQLAAEIKNALPQVLQKDDFARFNTLYYLSLTSLQLDGCISPFEIIRAATAMRDKGYPQHFESLCELAKANPQLDKSIRRIRGNIVIESMDRDGLVSAHAPSLSGLTKGGMLLSVMFTEKGIFCQDEKTMTGGKSPVEMIQHWRAAVPDEAAPLTRALEKLLQERAFRGLRSAREAYQEIKSLDMS
jgi:hypothetical protein